MRKLLKPLALFLALSLLLTVGAFASGDPSGASSEEPAADSAPSFAQVDETHWAGDSLTVESVEIAEEYQDYVDAAQFCNISKIVYDGGEIDVDYTRYVAILTVDTVQFNLYNAAGETFEGDVVITLVEKDASTNSGNAKFGDDAGSLVGDFYFTAAAYFNEDGYQEKSSVVEAQDPACVIDGDTITGMYYMSVGDYMSGVYANAGELTIKDSIFVAYGKGGDDFTGRGISVVAAGDAKVTVDGCFFVSEGALRSALWSGSSAEMNVVDTVVQTYNDEELVAYNTDDNYATPMMQQVPFALGLTGNIRATLDAGMATINFKDSLIASNGWAVLSTDSGSGTLTATDTTAVLGYVDVADAVEEGSYDAIVTVNGEDYAVTAGRVGEESGYVCFCDGFTNFVNGGRWYAPDYLCIITGGSVTIGASDNGRFYGWCDRIGFLTNQTAAGGNPPAMTISEADFDVTDTFMLVKTKGGNAENILLEDVSVNLTGENPWGGNLLELIDSDDLGGGPGATTYAIPFGSYDEYLTAESGGEGKTTTFDVKDSELAGNIFNSVGSQTGSQTAFKNDAIAVSLENSTLTGIVSSAYAAHCTEDGTLLTGTAIVDSYGREGTYDYLTIGRVRSFAAPTVNNPVTLSLVNSTWTVAGLSYLASLTIDDASEIVGDVYQDGQKLELKAGTYENVVAVPAGAAYDGTVAMGASAAGMAIAAGIVPADRSDLVANTDLGSSGEASGDASAESASGEAS